MSHTDPMGEYETLRRPRRKKPSEAQADLFAQPPPPAMPVPTPPLARTSDPVTSKESAAILKGSEAHGREQLRALRLVDRHPGETASALSRLAGDEDPRRVNRRLTELAANGLIYPVSVVVDSVTRRAQRTWNVTEAGRRALTNVKG